MPHENRSVLLRDEGPTVAVRVRSGFAVKARDDHAPSVSEFFEVGDEIPNLDAAEAADLLALGAVELV